MPIKPINISGVVLDSLTNKGITGLTVEAWDKDMLFDDLVSSTVTGKNGQFKFSFTQKYFSELFTDRKPDLYFKIFQDGKLLLNTVRSVTWNIANDKNDIEIKINSGHSNGNPLPGADHVTFTGQVKHATGNVIAGITVRVSEQKLREKIKIAEATTDTQGMYRLEIGVPAGNPAFVTEALDTHGIVLASSKAVFPDEYNLMDLTVESRNYKGASDYALHSEALKKYWKDLSAPGSTISVSDIHFIAQQAKLEAKNAWRWVRAQLLEVKTGLSGELFFGLFMQGMPNGTEELSAHDSATFKNVILEAVEENHISENSAKNVDAFVAGWKQFTLKSALDVRAPKLDASLGDILGVAVSSTDVQQQILTRYLDHEGSLEKFWKDIAPIAGGEKQVKDMQLSLQLAVLTGNQPVVTKALLEESAKNENGKGIGEFARWDESDWITYINALSKKTKKSVVPVFIEESTEEERVKTYARKITQTLEKTFPTDVFFNTLGKDDAQSGVFSSSRQDLLTFFSKNPSFDLRNTSTLALRDDDSLFDFSGVKNKIQTITQLQSVQRLSAYSSNFSVISELKTHKLDSAYAIVQMPQADFVASFSGTFGSTDKARTAYMKAVNTYMQGAMLWGKVNPNLNIATNVTPCSLTLSASADPTLRSMFGSVEACECEHCASVFSPAAYYADILNFLYSRTPEIYNELVRRRPDLPFLELNCENTNTALPYVDLVNELLENFVITHKTVPGTVTGSFQTTWQSQELFANPEHLNYGAYDELEKIVFPNALPFNLPLEETRIYLKHLGVQHHQLMSSFFPGMPEDAFDDAEISAERLMISPQEMKIITGATTGDGSADNGTWNFYGFNKASGYKAITDPLDSGATISGGTWISVLSGRVDVFLQQTSLVYKELITLLSCDFINPADNSGTRKITIVAVATDADGNEVQPDTCDLSLLELQGMDAHDLGKIHRFLRLWRKLGCSMYDIDKATAAFAITDFNTDGTRKAYASWFTDNEVKKITQADFLRRHFTLTLEEVLVFWSDMQSTDYTDYFSESYPPLVSLYAKLFRNKSILNPVDPAFTEDPAGLAGTMDDHTAVIFAALQINDTDYNYLKSDATVLTNTNLTIGNLSSLYRHVVLAKRLRYSIKDFLALKSLIGSGIFVNPTQTFAFLRKADGVKTSGFSVHTINYLLRHEYLEETGVAPTDVSISVFLSELRAAVRGLEAASDDEKKSTIRQKFSEKLGISPTASQLLLNEYVKSTADSTRRIEDDFWSADFSSSDFLKAYSDPTDITKAVEPVFVRAGAIEVTDVEVPVLFDNYMRLEKIATIINKLRLSDTDLSAILAGAAKMVCTDLSTLPVTASSASFDEFETLINLIRARDLMPVGSPEYFSILAHAVESDTADSATDKQAAKENWLANLVLRTNWDTSERTSIEFLVGAADVFTDGGVLKADFPEDFRNGDIILSIKNGLTVLNRIGLSTEVVKGALDHDVTDALAQAIKNAAKAKYDEAQWSKVAKPLRNELREKQREALVGYAITRADSSKNERWKNSDELYEYLLIDVEMKPVSLTSRMKQAICSVQLFVDRVLMNLEYPLSDHTQTALALEGEQVEEWREWRKLYRVWEANRKIFLYPENWLEPELRDDKSPFFKELETQLMQNELSDENVEDCFHNYLEKLDGVARLEIVGMYRETEAATDEEEAVDILHVFGRTFSHPHKYYHRTFESSEWTAWTRLEIDVDGDHLVPVVFNRRLCLFWLIFTQQSEEQNELDPSDSVSSPPVFWKVQIAWSEYKKNKWTAKKVSKNYCETERIESDDDQNQQLLELKEVTYMETEQSDGCLYITVHNGGKFEIGLSGSVRFVFRSTNDDPAVEGGLGQINLLAQQAKDTVRSEMMREAMDDGQPFTLTSSKWTVNEYRQVVETVEEKNILGTTGEGKFKIITPAHSSDTFASDFFFQDNKNTFYVKRIEIQQPNFWKDLDNISIGAWQNELIQNWELENIFSDLNILEGNIFSDDLFEFDNGNGSVIIHHNNGGNNGGMIVMPIAVVNAGRARATGKTGIPIVNTQKINGYLVGNGMQLVRKFTPIEAYDFDTFYHGHVQTFIRALNKLGTDGLLTRAMQTQADTINFSDALVYEPISVDAADYPTTELDFAFGGPYSQYNWELFFHVPMLIACRLSKDQRFEEARKWFHYIFDPTNSENGSVQRFWQFKPFYDEAGQEIETLDDLLRNETELSRQVEKWMADPFQPHVIARMRTSAYMKNVVMKYIDNLIAWGDQLFRRDTIESINEATNLYILASKILGEKPQQVPSRAAHAEYSFDDIKDEMDSFSNALVDIETFLSPSASSSGTITSGAEKALGEMFYFCVPRNEYLMKYWETVADRLFKIRHSMNIEGVVRTLPLFEPPIDPAMLVRAAAMGMDLSSILGDVSAALPTYRFSFMLQKANELAGEVKGLGAALLQALEKKDAETISLLRSGHEQKMLSAVLAIKSRQVEDAKTGVEASKKSLEIAQLKHTYYSGREFTNTFEKQHLTSLQIGMVLSAVQGELETIGGVMAAIPNFKLGAPTSIGATWGGDNMANLMRAISSYIGIYASINNTQGTMASTLAGYTRRMDDWKFQTDSSKKEIEQLEKQVLSSEIKLAVAEKDLVNQQLQIENAAELDEFMRSKFTNQQLYEWMTGQLATVYFQSYQLAYDVAKQAQQCYEYELGQYGEASFIQFGYWDSLKKGLLSAERLQFDLRRMEMSFYAENTRELELSKSISIMLLDPQAILDLRTTGKCTLRIPEEIYDFDYPGHYFRRLKSVSLSIPCIAGPYTSVNCTLRSTANITRLDTSGSTYESADYSSEDRFRYDTQVRSIATSTAQNDSGVFELNFKDERYLPFEGLGAFGEWQITLNEDEELRMFDYNTISDIIVHVKYTAREDAGTFKDGVVSYLKDLLKTTVVPSASSSGLQLWRMFSSRYEFSGDWYKFLHPSDGGDQQLNLTLDNNRFPFLTQERTISIKAVHVYGSFDSADAYLVELTKLTDTSGTNKITLTLDSSNNYHKHADDTTSAVLSGDLVDMEGISVKVRKSTLTNFTSLGESEVKDLIVVMEYELG